MPDDNNKIFRKKRRLDLQLSIEYIFRHQIRDQRGTKPLMSLKRKILDYDFAGLLPKKQTVYIFRKMDPALMTHHLVVNFLRTVNFAKTFFPVNFRENLALLYITSVKHTCIL